MAYTVSRRKGGVWLRKESGGRCAAIVAMIGAVGMAAERRYVPMPSK